MCKKSVCDFYVTYVNSLYCGLSLVAEWYIWGEALTEVLTMFYCLFNSLHLPNHIRGGCQDTGNVYAM